MIRRSLFAAALIFMGSLALAPKTMAQTVDVPFTGTIGGACTFGQVTPGSLGVNQVTNPTALAGGFPGGTLGKVSVTCNTPASVVTSPAVQTGGPAFTPINNTSSSAVRIAGSGSWAVGTPLQLNPGISLPLEVDMFVDKGSTLSPGTYNYKVTLTITP
ncbi:hypothetical protein WDZ92_23270 [Nostoc sp. NIES-2111]